MDHEETKEVEEVTISERKAIGGYARAKALTPERRKEIARMGGRAKGSSNLPQATHEGVLEIGQMKIPCAVLENGQRVITQSGFMIALGRARQAKGRGYYNADVNMPAFLTAKNLKPFISQELEVTSSQIEFKPLKGAKAFGYPAELLPKVCDVFLDAEAANALTASQRHIAARAHILIRGLAHVGIIALVDEATGFQYDRARTALAEILERFIAKELARWVKTFPDEFYQQLFRLRNWEKEPLHGQRPRVIGKWTNDIIYARLAPGVLDELKRITPRRENGRYKHKLFQRLTPDPGVAALREHLASVTTIMALAPNWHWFMDKLDRRHPKINTTLLLPFPETEEG